MKRQKSAFFSFFDDPVTRYTLIVSIILSVLLISEVLYPILVDQLARIGITYLKESLPKFVTEDDKLFSRDFIEWIGALYGVFISLALIRAVDGFEKVKHEFEIEAANVRALHEVVLLLDDKDLLSYKKKLICKLHLYCRHVVKRHEYEQKEENNYFSRHGDSILRVIRSEYNNLIHKWGESKSKKLEVVKTEFLGYFNKIVETRAKRLTLSRMVSFGDLGLFVVVSSVLWLLPFYFLNYDLGGLGQLIKISVTFLTIFVLSLIDDLNNHFTGVLRIGILPWVQVEKETKSSLDNLVKKSRKAESLKKEDQQFFAWLFNTAFLLHILWHTILYRKK